METFRGPIHHTARWPHEGVDLQWKTGSRHRHRLVSAYRRFRSSPSRRRSSRFSNVRRNGRCRRIIDRLIRTLSPKSRLITPASAPAIGWSRARNYPIFPPTTFQRPMEISEEERQRKSWRSVGNWGAFPSSALLTTLPSVSKAIKRRLISSAIKYKRLSKIRRVAEMLIARLYDSLQAPGAR